jgi:peptide/nickel transport system permease protein
MARYVLMRVAVAIPLLVVMSFVVFSFLHLAPGSPEALLTGGRPVDQATLAALRARYHLDDPFLVQYGDWLVNALQGRFGESFAHKDEVSAVVGGRVVPTLQLAGLATLIVILVGIPLGVLAAVRRNSAVDGAVSLLALVLSSTAAYVSGILLIIVFAVQLGWFPVFGLGEGGLGDRLYHLTLPAIALAGSLTALTLRVTRAAMTDVLASEHIETARARGFGGWRVVGRHGLRNALVPVLTVGGLAAGYLISGSVLVEYTFGLNGLGSLLISAVQEKDFPVVQAITLMFTGVFIAINIVVDLLYGLVDPRIRLRGVPS